MSDEPVRPIIIKKKVIHGGHHGGAWKIAFADFMTAMMAFFLVMWLLSTATEKQLVAISDYFSQSLTTAMGRGFNTTNIVTSSSPIPGGGEDPMKTEGEVRKEQEILMSTSELDEANLKRMATDLSEAVAGNDEIRKSMDQIRFEMTPDGLMIQILDTEEKSMFEMGRAKVSPRMHELLHTLAPIINKMTYKISLGGHTDDTPYASGDKGYSNWELSADRANAARRTLVEGGLEADKLLRVVGRGSSNLLDKEDGKNPKNRRITITILNKQAQYRIQNADKFSNFINTDEWLPEKIRQER